MLPIFKYQSSCLSHNEVEIDEWLIEHNQHVYSGAAAMQNMWLVAWSLFDNGINLEHPFLIVFSNKN